MQRRDVLWAAALAAGVLATLLVVTVTADVNVDDEDRFSRRAPQRFESCGSVLAPPEPGAGPFGSADDDICNGHRWAQAHLAVLASAATFVIVILAWQLALARARFRDWYIANLPVAIAKLAVAVGVAIALVVISRPATRPGGDDPCGNLLVTIGEADSNPDACTSAKSRQVLTGIMAGSTAAGAVLLAGAALARVDEARSSREPRSEPPATA